MKNLTVFIAVFIGLSLTACDDDTVAKNVVNEPDLNGRYSAECKQVPVVEVASQETLRFEADADFESYTELFSSDNCSGSEIVGTVRIVGEYSVDSDGAPSSEGGALELTLRQAFVQLDTDALVTAANMASFCGSSEYQKGVEVEISGSETDDFNCPFVKSVPDTLFGVYREDEGTFYLNEGGLSQMGQSSENRPTELDLGVPYVKQ